METKIIASKFNEEIETIISGQRTVTYGQQLWPKLGYFSGQTNNFNMQTLNYSGNSIIYVNQGYLTMKQDKRMFYADYHIRGQISEALDVPENISNYVCKERKVKII